MGHFRKVWLDMLAEAPWELTPEGQGGGPACTTLGQVKRGKALALSRKSLGRVNGSRRAPTAHWPRHLKPRP